MANINRKVVLIGTGMVGMSFAYAALNQSICDELVLIDLNDVRAKGEAMDLNHGLAFSNSSMKIYFGDYSDCSNADIAVICVAIELLIHRYYEDPLRLTWSAIILAVCCVAIIALITILSRAHLRTAIRRRLHF